MKKLISNKTDFDNFLSIWTGYYPNRGNVISAIGEPKKYPCVLLFEIKVDDNGPDYIDGDYVYLDDFELENNNNII